MNSPSKHACRFLLAAVFIFAGVTKIAHPADFFSDLLSYRVPWPEMFLRVVAVFLPWLEVLAGLGLLLNVWAESIRPLVSALCLVFVVMLGQAVLRGLELNCGCFGAVGAGWFERPDVALVRAALLFAGSLYITAVRSTQPTTPAA